MNVSASAATVRPKKPFVMSSTLAQSETSQIVKFARYSWWSQWPSEPDISPPAQGQNLQPALCYLQNSRWDSCEMCFQKASAISFEPHQLDHHYHIRNIIGWNSNFILDFLRSSISTTLRQKHQLCIQVVSQCNWQIDEYFLTTLVFTWRRTLVISRLYQLFCRTTRKPKVTFYKSKTITVIIMHSVWSFKLWGVMKLQPKALKCHLSILKKSHACGIQCIYIRSFLNSWHDNGADHDSVLYVYWCVLCISQNQI